MPCRQAASAEPLPLFQDESLISPWPPMLSLTGGTVEPDEAAGFRLADDAKVGRALVVGPWVAGAWWARAQYEKPFPPLPTEIRGRYRTVDLLPYTAGVRADFYDARGQRLNRVSYPLLPAADWTPFSVRFDKFPVGTARMEFSFGLAQHTKAKSGLRNWRRTPPGRIRWPTCRHRSSRVPLRLRRRKATPQRNFNGSSRPLGLPVDGLA